MEVNELQLIDPDENPALFNRLVVGDIYGYVTGIHLVRGFLALPSRTAEEKHEKLSHIGYYLGNIFHEGRFPSIVVIDGNGERRSFRRGYILIPGTRQYAQIDSDLMTLDTSAQRLLDIGNLSRNYHLQNPNEAFSHMDDPNEANQKRRRKTRSKRKSHSKRRIRRRR